MKYSNEKKDLAAALRWFARLDMNEGIANHFSLAVSDDGQEFLMNPAGKYWSKIKSSDILELDARKDPKNIGPIVDETAWCIHGAIHRQVPSARCVMHLHPKYATALSCLEDPKLPAINQESMTFYNRVSYDLDYGGLGIGDEGERLASRETEMVLVSAISVFPSCKINRKTVSANQIPYWSTGNPGQGETCIDLQECWKIPAIPLL